MIELADHGAVGTFLGEGADMGFRHDGFVPRTSTPVRGAPRIACVIDDFAGARNVIRLKRRSRVGYIDLVVDPEFVPGAGLCARHIGRKPAVFAALHGLRFCQQQIDTLRRRRPQPKRRAICCQPGAELPLIHAEPAKTRTERGGAFASLPEADSAAAWLTSAVFNSCCQLLYSGSFGNLNAIASGAALTTMQIGGFPSSSRP